MLGRRRRSRGVPAQRGQNLRHPEEQSDAVLCWHSDSVGRGVGTSGRRENVRCAQNRPKRALAPGFKKKEIPGEPDTMPNKKKGNDCVKKLGNNVRPKKGAAAKMLKRGGKGGGVRRLGGHLGMA